MMPRRKSSTPPEAEFYQHPESESLLRPDVGTQAQFRKKKPPKTYRYDSSLAPELRWDGQNPAREEGEQRLATATDQLSEIRKKLSDAEIKKLIAENPDLSNEAVLRLVAGNLEKAEEALRELKAMSGPFLNWAGKAERLSFDVPTLSLFVHERLSTKAILETLKGHTRDRQADMFQLFGDPQHSVTDQILGAYEHTDKWVNRMVLGDSLVVMNSLLRYEFLGEQVQMIYIDPPYGVKFGSNFQPFVRKRNVSHNDDDDLTREPEMVQAYRDTWELGLHSYLTYLRDRLMLARDLLNPTGSVFVQISDENLHHVRELLDEVFGAENFCARINVIKTAGQTDDLLSSLSDSVLWYAREKERVKFRPLFVPKGVGFEEIGQYYYADLPSGDKRRMTQPELENPSSLPLGTRFFRVSDLSSNKYYSLGRIPFEFEGKTYLPPEGRYWTHSPEGRENLKEAGRVIAVGNSVRFIGYLDDFPFTDLTNQWTDTGVSGFAAEKLYVVQTNPKIVERCVLMTTDPGDLILDPTCGGGTTPYVAELWGRRWITIDTSRVPLALSRQRLLTATFPYFDLMDETRGPVGGFRYESPEHSKNSKPLGAGVIPNVTIKSIANKEPPIPETLVDRPERISGKVRVTGPFWFEATIPTPVDWEGDGVEDSGVAEDYGSFVERMLEVLRRSPVLRLEGNRTVTFKGVRPPAKTLSLSAEALVENGDEKPVAFVFGPENGAVSEKLVFEAAREAYAKSYTHLYVIGFAIQPNARTLVDNCAEVVGIPATYVQATPDLMMGDLLKHMRSSQIFSVCGLPEIKVHRKESKEGPHQYQVELVGLDVFDPMTMEVDHEPGGDVPAWFLDTNYNELSFHVSQAFFPRTSAWDNLKRALRGVYEDSVWEHLASNKSEPFEAGEHKQIAVKVIDDRGNELLVVEKL